MEVKHIMNEFQLTNMDGELYADSIIIDELVHQAFLSSYQNLDIALKLVDEAFHDLNCPWIEHCVRETVMRWFLNSQPNEQTVYAWFTKMYKEKLGKDWEIIKVKNNPNHIPDFWLSNGKGNVPVECKIGKFDAKALKQLQRYMQYYGCQNGIAVAKTLCVDLPSSITFIGFELDDLEDS